MLYYYGVNNDEVTGGWSAIAALPSGMSNATKPTLTMETDHIKVKSSSGSGGSVFTAYKIDLTDYQYVKINCTRSGGSAYLLTANINNNGYETDAWATIGTGDIAMDVSALSGSYYLGLRLYNSTVKIYSIELIS